MFINTCLKYYGLGPCVSLSSLGLSWDATLKMTKIELEPISNIDVHYFIEKGMIGGISYIPKRHSKANNKYMKSYDRNKPSIYIPYLDANNLYGLPMCQCLPYGGFMWLSQKEIDNIGIISVSENSSNGCILKVDIEYAHEFHVLYNDYPLAPEKLEIICDMLPDYCKKIAHKYGIKVSGVKKLVPNLDNKTKYVVHYKNRQFYLSLGMKLTKVHRVLKLK